MKILRRGASANHGTKIVELKLANLRWNSSAEVFEVTFSGAATDFSTDGRHTYSLRFAPKEIAMLLQKLPEAGASMESEDFAASFEKATPSLFKLQAMASGFRLAA